VPGVVPPQVQDPAFAFVLIFALIFFILLPNDNSCIYSYMCFLAMCFTYLCIAFFKNA